MITALVRMVFLGQAAEGARDLLGSCFGRKPKRCVVPVETWRPEGSAVKPHPPQVLNEDLRVLNTRILPQERPFSIYQRNTRNARRLAAASTGLNGVIHADSFIIPGPCPEEAVHGEVKTQSVVPCQPEFVQ